MPFSGIICIWFNFKGVDKDNLQKFLKDGKAIQIVAGGNKLANNFYNKI